jgi:hypothetical protein
MPEEYRKIRIFVASPGDVLMEREQLARVVEELNITIPAIAPEKKVVLELVRWETHTHPAIGAEPQAVVNEQIGDYDIFVGILWKRMGTPTATAASGTEEEFRRAYDRWQTDRSLPIMFYFCQQPFPPPRSGPEVRQLYAVVKFRRNLDRMGIARDYASHDQFAETVRPDLLLSLGRLLSPDRTVEQAVEAAPAPTSESTRQAVLALALEYDRVRNGMKPGSARTSKMELIASHMRSQAIAGYGLLSALSRSVVPGERLAAATFLQAIPNQDYIFWLTERFRVEKPFVAYHAGLALLATVRTSDRDSCSELKKAIDLAEQALLDTLGDKAPSTDRYHVVEEARREWETRFDPDGKMRAGTR